MQFFCITYIAAKIYIYINSTLVCTGIAITCILAGVYSELTKIYDYYEKRKKAFSMFSHVYQSAVCYLYMAYNFSGLDASKNAFFKIF